MKPAEVAPRKNERVSWRMRELWEWGGEGERRAAVSQGMRSFKSLSSASIKVFSIKNKRRGRWQIGSSRRGEGADSAAQRKPVARPPFVVRCLLSASTGDLYFPFFL